MPKYYEFKVAGYFLYFTSYCIVECMHVHASDRRLTESGSAKFFVKSDGEPCFRKKAALRIERCAGYRSLSKKIIGTCT